MRLPFSSYRHRATEIAAPTINLLDPDLWDDIPEDVQIQLLRQAEERVWGTLSIAHAADQRATTTMGICAAGGVALLAASATIISGSHPDLRLICAAVAMASGLFLASVMCALAIAPTDFFAPGFDPLRLIDSDARQSKLLRPTLIGTITNRIAYNQAAIRRAAKCYELALQFGGAGIIAGIGFLILWVAAGDGRSF